ncbi:MAG: hypothetical protein M3N47_14640 [Chloroflexota bacterium]|nr:hypothetical protein [Chloroflexota bacterium]
MERNRHGRRDGRCCRGAAEGRAPLRDLAAVPRLLGRGLRLLLQRLDLLKHAFELVLCPAELAAEPCDVLPASQPQIPNDQVERRGRDAVQCHQARHDACEKLGEAVARDQPLGRAGCVRLGLLEDASDARVGHDQPSWRPT